MKGSWSWATAGLEGADSGQGVQCVAKRNAFRVHSIVVHHGFTTRPVGDRKQSGPVRKATSKLSSYPVSKRSLA